MLHNIYKENAVNCFLIRRLIAVGPFSGSKSQYIQPKLFNLSNTTLSKCQTSILLRGLKFTPTPKTKSIQLTFHLKTFTHKLRITEYFDDHKIKPIDQKNESLVKFKLLSSEE